MATTSQETSPAPTPPGSRAADAGRQIPALTGVRALAAYLVFFHHHRTPWLEVGPLTLWLELHIGVTLFFVLSGFVITWRYDGRGPERHTFLRGYFVNRFARIYPLYFVLVVPTMLFWGEKSARVWFLNLTVFSCFDSGIPQAWSLRVEECFYLAAPLIFLGWRRHPLLPLGVAALVLAALYPVATLPAAAGILGPPHYLLLYTFFGRFFEFYAGVWLAKRVARTGIPGGEARGGFPALTVGGAAGIAAVVVALAALRAANASTYVYGLYHPAGIALNNLVLPVCIAAFYLGLIRERTPLRRILSGRVAGLLGRSSYAFYLVHIGVARDYFVRAFVLGAGLFGAGAMSWATRVGQSILGLFVLANVFAILLYKGIESPANRLLRRRFAGPAAAARAA
jgi:peptidoglycan/LPS O-acetylase OafA/YrhL